MKLVYVAGPYRGAKPFNVKQNIMAADLFGMEVCKTGALPVIPHCNTAGYEGIQDDQYFLDATMELCRRCDALITLPTWERSSGARAEVAEMKRLGKPVFHSIEALEEWLSNGTQGVSNEGCSLRTPTRELG